MRSDGASLQLSQGSRTVTPVFADAGPEIVRPPGYQPDQGVRLRRPLGGVRPARMPACEFPPRPGSPRHCGFRPPLPTG